MKNYNKIYYALIVCSMLIIYKVYGQMEVDPIASQMVRQESVDRRMEDMQIKNDIRLRDNQTANAINDFKGENNKRLEKSIDEMKRVYELLRNTYNSADPIKNYNESREFVIRQRSTVSNILRLLGTLSFSKEMISPRLMEDVIQSLILARRYNKEALDIYNEAVNPNNPMTTGERAIQIKEAIYRNGRATEQIEQSLMRLKRHESRYVMQKNNKELINVISIF